jgi:hypothetical protein
MKRVILICLIISLIILGCAELGEPKKLDKVDPYDEYLRAKKAEKDAFYKAQTERIENFQRKKEEALTKLSSIVELQNPNPEKCQELPTEESYTAPGNSPTRIIPGIYTCYYILAIKLNDSSLCSNLRLINRNNSVRGLMPWSVKSVNEKYNYSHYLTNANIFLPGSDLYCLARVKGFSKESFCNPIDSDFLKSSCYYNTAKVLNDIEICKKHSLDGCLIDFASQSNSIATCNEMESLFNKNRCFSKLAVQLHKVEICDRIDNPIQGEGCIFNVAVKQNSIPLCKKINDSEEIERCFWHIARNTSNIELCLDIIKQPRMRDFCISDVAEALNSVSYCKEINGLSSKELCISQVAEQLVDVELCKEITSSNIHDNCISDIAAQKKDSQLCTQFIVRTDKIDYCIEQVAKNSE